MSLRGDAVEDRDTQGELHLITETKLELHIGATSKGIPKLLRKNQQEARKDSLTGFRHTMDFGLLTSRTVRQ